MSKKVLIKKKNIDIINLCFSIFEYVTWRKKASVKYGITYTVTNTASIPVQFSVNETKTINLTATQVD